MLLSSPVKVAVPALLWVHRKSHGTHLFPSGKEISPQQLGPPGFGAAGFGLHGHISAEATGVALDTHFSPSQKYAAEM